MASELGNKALRPHILHKNAGMSPTLRDRACPTPSRQAEVRPSEWAALKETEWERTVAT